MEKLEKISLICGIYSLIGFPLGIVVSYVAGLIGFIPLGLYFLCVPVSIILGFISAYKKSFRSVGVLSMVFGLLSIFIAWLFLSNLRFH